MLRADASPRFDLLVAGISGLASVALVIGTVAVEQIRVTHEIQLWAPTHAQEGDAVPVRALVLTDLDTREGPSLSEAPVSVQLRMDDSDFAGIELSRAGFASLEGRLGLAEAPFRTLRAEARENGQLLASVERPIEIVPALTEPLPLRSRLGDPLQTLMIARTLDLDSAFREVDVRVVGGVCVAEQPCTLLVMRGEHVVTPSLVDCTTLDVLATRDEGQVVEIDLVVHGAEARCSLSLPLPAGTVLASESLLSTGRITNDAVPDATTDGASPPLEGPPTENVAIAAPSPAALLIDLQIPLALATPWLTAEASESDLRITGEPPPGRDEILVDLFLDERWIAAETLRRGVDLTLDLEGVGAGVLRVQARADVSSSEHAYQRALAWPSLDPAREAVGRICRAPAASWDAERTRWELARIEGQLVDVPALSSGYEADAERLAAHRTTMRWIAVGGVLMAVILTLAAVTRRGLASAREAREVLVEAGDEAADDPGARWRSWLTVVAFVAAMGLAILLGAAFLVARPFFMG